MIVGEKNLATHLVGISELVPISIDDGVGGRDEWRREGNLPPEDSAILCMRLVSDGFLLDMIVARASCSVSVFFSR